MCIVIAIYNESFYHDRLGEGVDWHQNSSFQYKNIFLISGVGRLSRSSYALDMRRLCAIGLSALATRRMEAGKKYK